jgi:hypothetical protein
MTLCAGNGAVLPGSAQQAKFVYFFEGVRGKFIKVDLETQQVVDHGTIRRDERADRLLPFTRDTILIHQMLYDPRTGHLYLKTPAETASLPVFPLSFRVLVLKLPTLEFIGALHESNPVKDTEESSLVLLLSQDGKRLLLLYEKPESSKRSVVISELYDITTLKLVKNQETELPENWRELDRVSENTYWGLDPKKFYDGDLQSGEECSKTYDAAGYLPTEVERLLKQRPSSFGFIFVNAKAVLWERESRQHIHRYRGQRDGKDQDIEEKNEVPYSTGRILVYDQSGKKMFELNEDGLSGEYPKILTVSPDGRMMYFVIGHDRLYAIDLREKKSPVRIETHEVDVMFATCLFADR